MDMFEQVFNVELSDITPSFGLKPTSVLKYYQETFARYCAEHNVAGYDVYRMGLKWVFGQTIVKYLDIIPIWNEKVTARVWISTIKKLRIYIDFEVRTSRGIVASGQSIAYILDLNTSRPKPVDNIIEHFNLDLNSLSNDILSCELNTDGKLTSEQTHKITFSDVDYNNHTNNIAYLLFAIEGMGTDYVKNFYPKYMEIKYLQETFLHDELKCEIYKNNDDFEYKITNLKDNSDVCKMKISWQTNNMNPESFFEILKTVRQA